MPSHDDRPLGERIDAFWRAGVPDPVEGGDGSPTALDELGSSGIVLHGRALDAVLAAAYRRFTGGG
ncbi:hypothetical protein ACFCX4_22970 [Kitasatospora sp. NPDC056327]|uniref:hypothetical protein n=1 Tax=Kitasatospora sp. NPDC056327 TaxID=3345785 RepID=UPI0035DDE5CD